MIVLALAAGAVGVRMLFPQALDLHSVRAFVEGWGPLAYLVAYVLLTTVQVPATLMSIVGVVAFGFERGWLLAQLGINLAASFSYLIGRLMGLARLRTWLEAKGVKLDAGHSLPALIMLRFIPIPYLWINVAAGASKVPWPAYALGTFLGLLIPTTVFTFSAAQLADGVEGANTRAVVMIAVSGVAIFLTMLLGRWLRNRFAPRP